MRNYVLLSLLAVTLGACSTTSLAQQEANAELTKRVGERLRYCGIQGSIDAGLGTRLGGNGAATSFNIDCPAAPFPKATEPENVELTTE